MRIDGASLGGTFGLFDGLREKTDAMASGEHGAAGAGSASAGVSSLSQASTGNLMAGNFVHAGSNASKYTKARSAALQAGQAMRSRQSAVLQSGMATLAGITASSSGGENYAELTLAGKKAARSMRREETQSVSERSEENLDEIKDDVESRAEKAMAPAGAVIREEGMSLPEPQEPEKNGTGKAVPSAAGSADQGAPASPLSSRTLSGEDFFRAGASAAVEAAGEIVAEHSFAPVDIVV